MNDEINRSTEQVIGAGIEVHRELGPGLLESAYQRALAHYLRLRKILIDDAYRLDFFVGGLVVVELKTVDALLDVHEAQVLTYLRFTKCHVGLLMNFRSTILMRGLKRLAL